MREREIRQTGRSSHSAGNVLRPLASLGVADNDIDYLAQQIDKPFLRDQRNAYLR